MKKHTKIYIESMGYSKADWMPCEICNQTAVDVNHIEPRGMGGSKTKDYPENLVGLCRRCHQQFENKEIPKNLLQQIHNKKLNERRLSH